MQDLFSILPGYDNGKFHNCDRNICDAVQNIRWLGFWVSLGHWNHGTFTVLVLNQRLALHSVDVHDSWSVSNWTCLVSASVTE
jgi:hypothetical protein